MPPWHWPRTAGGAPGLGGGGGCPTLAMEEEEDSHRGGSEEGEEEVGSPSEDQSCPTRKKIFYTLNDKSLCSTCHDHSHPSNIIFGKETFLAESIVILLQDFRHKNNTLLLFCQEMSCYESEKTSPTQSIPAQEGAKRNCCCKKIRCTGQISKNSMPIRTQ